MNTTLGRVLGCILFEKNFNKRHHLSFDPSILNFLANLLEVNMFWLSMIVLSLSFVLVKLGAVSVWMGILSAAFKVALLVIAGLVLILLWNKVANAKS